MTVIFTIIVGSQKLQNKKYTRRKTKKFTHLYIGTQMIIARLVVSLESDLRSVPVGVRQLVKNVKPLSENQHNSWTVQDNLMKLVS